MRPAPGTSQPKITGLSRPSRGAHPRRAWPCGELDKPENCQVCPVLSPVARQAGWSIRPHGSSLHQSPQCCHAAHINNRITSSTQQNLCLFCCVQSRNVKNRNICVPALNPCGSPSALAAAPPVLRDCPHSQQNRACCGVELSVPPFSSVRIILQEPRRHVNTFFDQGRSGGVYFLPAAACQPWHKSA